MFDKSMWHSKAKIAFFCGIVGWVVTVGGTLLMWFTMSPSFNPSESAQVRPLTPPDMTIQMTLSTVIFVLGVILSLLALLFGGCSILLKNEVAKAAIGAILGGSLILFWIIGIVFSAIGGV